jgi:hypothetical protein
MQNTFNLSKTRMDSQVYNSHVIANLHCGNAAGGIGLSSVGYVDVTLRGPRGNDGRTT